MDVLSHVPLQLCSFQSVFVALRVFGEGHDIDGGCNAELIAIEFLAG